MVKVIVRLLYRMIELDNSVTMDTQLRIAPEMIPLDIIGTVIFTNVLSLEDPRLIAASSMLRGICISVALAERMEYGIRLMVNETIMIAIVPVRTKGGLLNAITKAMPMTDPGMI